MTYTAKEYHVWKRKSDNIVVGKVIEVNNGDSIDNYVEVELPDAFKKIIDKINGVIKTIRPQ
jgi:hypothetical protein